MAEGVLTGIDPADGIADPAGSATVELTGRHRPDGGGSIAIVHDYLTQRGGAERVVLAMLRAFPDATLHTSLYQPQGTFPEFQNYHVRTMPINKVRLFRRYHRTAFPLLAASFSSYRIDADVVLCSSSGWAHGVRTSGAKIVYCHTPARWLYQTQRYVGRDGGSFRGLRLAAAYGLRAPLQAWDRRAAATADRYLANSRVVQDRVRELYGLQAELVPPPVSIDINGPETAVREVEPGFLLCVSRLLPYKNVDSVVDAMRLLPDERLVVVGSGPELTRLRTSAPQNVALIGRATDSQLCWLYGNCRAVVAASHEDFGLVPLEAAAFGKPTAALRWGGFLDTIVEGRTGVFFDEAEPHEIATAVRLLSGQLNTVDLQQHARGYGPDAFSQRLLHAVAEARTHRA